MAIGWSAFNLVEGVVDHDLLGFHHVKERPRIRGSDLGVLARF